MAVAVDAVVAADAAVAAAVGAAERRRACTHAADHPPTSRIRGRIARFKSHLLAKNNPAGAGFE